MRALAASLPQPGGAFSAPPDLTVLNAEWCRVLHLEHARVEREQACAWRVVAVVAALHVLQGLCADVRRRGRPQKCRGQEALRRQAVEAMAWLGVADFEVGGVRLHVVPARTTVVSADDNEAIAVAVADSYVRVTLDKRAAQLTLPGADVIELARYRGRSVAVGR